MTDREKLIDILKSPPYGEYSYEEMADNLIAKGVTLQKCGRWISLTECANAGVYCSVCNKKVYKEDYAWRNRRNKLRSNYCPNCGAKMEVAK